MKRLIPVLLLVPCLSWASAWQGDFYLNDTVRCDWNSFDSAGASITRATNGTISVYKDGGTTQSTAGVTDTEDFDAVTGVHYIAIDTSADAFYVAGSDYQVVLSGATIDGSTVNAALCSFSIENRDLKGYVKARGEATTGSTTTVVELGSAAVSADDEFNYLEFWNIDKNERRAITDTDNANDTVTIYPPMFVATDDTDKWRIVVKSPQVTLDLSSLATASALTTHDGKLDTVDGIVDSILVDTAEIGAAGAGLTAVPYNAAWDADIQSEAADALAAYDPPTKAELDSGLAGLNDLSATGVRSAIGLASANMDTQLGIIDGNVDDIETAVAALNDVSTAEIVTAILAGEVEPQGGGIDLQCVLTTLLAYAGGTRSDSGAVSTYKDPSGTSNRLVGSVVGSTRSSITITCP